MFILHQKNIKVYTFQQILEFLGMFLEKNFQIPDPMIEKEDGLHYRIHFNKENNTMITDNGNYPKNTKK